MVELFGSRKYGDAVAPEGPYPKVIADRDCHGARCEGFGIRLIDELCYLQCFGIDPHHVCRLLSLACCQNGSIRSKSDVVYAKTQWNRIPLYRSLTARQPQEGLASPRGYVQPLPVSRNLNAVSSRGFTARHFAPAFSRVPFPEFAIVFAGHHLHAGSARICSALQEIGRDKAAARQWNDRVQSNRVRGDCAPDPGQNRGLAAGIDLEDFDGFSFPMMDRV